MHARAESGSASHNAYRAEQLGGSDTLLLPPGAEVDGGGEEAALPALPPAS